uniref:Uncharacterized protein n=1 Tax=Amphimedon queenslandica TaxID=400682 RepID=A0A1X7VAL0_AMPQE
MLNYEMCRMSYPHVMNVCVLKDKIVTVKPRRHPVPVHSLWHHIGIDFIGPISPTSRVAIVTY